MEKRFVTSVPLYLKLFKPDEKDVKITISDNTWGALIFLPNIFCIIDTGTRL
jgi:hypothetical protein